MRDENEILMKRAYWQGAFDALTRGEKSRSEKTDKDRVSAEVWLSALDWILGENGKAVDTLEKETGRD